MLSGSILKQVSEQLSLEFVWTAAQDAVAWGSEIYWVLFLRAGEQGGIDAVPGSAWAVVIDGQEFSGRTNITVAPGAMKELAAGSAFLKHDPFGRKAFDFSFSQYLNIYTSGGYIGTVTGEGSAVLDDLVPDAAPVLGASEVYLGQVLRIKPQGPLGATFRLRYQMGSAEGVIGEGLTEAVDWVVPEELGAQIPNTDRGVLRILCDAYRDGVPVGRSREAAVTVLVPEDAVPVVTEITWEDVGQAAKLGFLLRHMSGLRVSAKTQGAMGSRVVRESVSLNGEATTILQQAGDVELLVTVTDSRGRVGYGRQTLSVVDYEAPYIKVSAHRCLPDGTADDTGGWATVTVTASWTHLGHREDAGVELAVGEEETLRWALEAYTEGKALGDRIQNATFTALVPADENFTHAICGSIYDGIGRQEHGMALSTAYCVMDVLYGGRGVAFGAVAREPGFLCAMDAKFTGRVILPDGTDLMERLGQLTVDS